MPWCEALGFKIALINMVYKLAVAFYSSFCMTPECMAWLSTSKNFSCKFPSSEKKEKASPAAAQFPFEFRRDSELQHLGYNRLAYYS